MLDTHNFSFLLSWRCEYLIPILPLPVSNEGVGEAEGFKRIKGLVRAVCPTKGFILFMLNLPGFSMHWKVDAYLHVWGQALGFLLRLF
jgi:hypothetical protein